MVVDVLQKPNKKPEWTTQNVKCKKKGAMIIKRILLENICCERNNIHFV